MTVAVVCVALLGFLLFGLGLGVSLTRQRTNTIFGYSADPADPLYKMTPAPATQRVRAECWPS